MEEDGNVHMRDKVGGGNYAKRVGQRELVRMDGPIDDSPLDGLVGIDVIRMSN